MIPTRKLQLPKMRSSWLIWLVACVFVTLVGLARPVMAQQAQVNIQKTVNPTGAIPTGQNFTYTLLYSCASITVQCNNVVVTDILPSEVQFVSSTGSTHTVDNGQYNATTRTVTFVFKDPLPAGSTGDLKITVRFPNGSTPNGAVATNTATLTPANGNPVTSNPVQNSAVAQSKWTIKKTGPATGYLSSGGNNYDATYTLQLCADNSTGSLNLNNVQMVDTLPANVQYVSATGNPTVNGSTLTWNLGNLAVNSCATQSVTIRFPAANFSVGASVTNSISATGQPAGQTSTVTIGPGTATTILATFTPQPKGTLTKSASTIFAVGAEASYFLNGIENNGNVALSQYILTDNIPPQINVTRIATGRYLNITGVTNYAIRYQTNTTGATWNLWTTVTNLTQSQTLQVASLNLVANQYITALQWDFGNVPIGFIANGAPTIFGTVISPDRNGNPVASGSQIQNCATLSWNYLGTGGSSAPACVTKTIGDASARLAPEKIITGTVDPYLPGSLVGFRIRMRNHPSATSPVPNPIMADLLPAGLAYVDGSWTYEVATSAAPAPAFEKLDNYDNTGRTLLRWVWPVPFPINTIAYVRFQARILPGVQPGTFVNSYDITGNGVPILCTGGAGSRPDVNDVDGDGSRTDTLCYGTASLVVQPTATLDSIKWVKGELDADYSKFPQSGLTVPGGAADYRLTIKNSGNISMTNLSIVDILPFVGDTGVRDLSPRETVWRPNLIGQVAAPTGVTVFYSIARNPCRPEMAPGGPAGCEDPLWSTVPPADISTVQSLKFDFGALLVKPGDELLLEWPMRAPVNGPTNGEIAWNSFAYIATRTDTNATLLAAEPNKVGIALQALKPAGYGDFVWNDLNRDGIQDANEPGINGVRVELYQPGGDGATCTPDDQFIGFTATTDGGQYIFSNLSNGNYFAIFYLPPTYAVSPNDNASVDDSRDSDGLVGLCNGKNVAVTPMTQLELTEIDRTWDQGIYQRPPVAAVGNYVWFDVDGNGIQDEPSTNGINGVQVDLYTSAGTLISTTLTADDPGGNPGYYLFDLLTPGDYYLVFTRPVSSTFTSPDQGANNLVDSDADGNGKTITFTLVDGQYDPSWDAGIVRELGALSLGDRVWLDANNNSVYEPQSSEQGINGVKVNLLVDNNGDGLCTPGVDGFYATTTTATQNGVAGYYLFSSLLEGNYLVQIAPTNFASKGALHNLLSSGDNSAAPDPDNDVNNDDNGTPVANCGVASQAVTLLFGAEPIDDGDSDNTSNLSVDFGFYQLIIGSLGDRVWLDNNGDGVQDAGEPGIPSVKVTLTNSQGVAQSTTTGDNGLYLFPNLPADTYTVTVDATTLPANLKQTFDLDGLASPNRATATLGAGENRTDVDFGYQPGSVLGCLGDRVWLDSNGNGGQEGNEQGILNVKVILTNSQDVTQTLTTVANGFYQFCNLPAGTYTVTVDATTLPPNLKQTFDLDGLATLNKATAALGAGQTRGDVDFGYQPTVASLGNYAWIDSDNDGQKDSNESPVPDGVVVELLDGFGNSLGKTTTTVNGFYLFSQLTSGNYRVRLAASNFATGGLLDNHVSSTGAGQEADPDSNGDQNDNGLDTGTPEVGGIVSEQVTLGDGEPTGETPTANGTPGNDGQGTPDNQSNLALDFGLVPQGVSGTAGELVALGNRIFMDQNRNSRFDPTDPVAKEAGLNGVVVQLLRFGVSTPISSTVTANGGLYAFDRLPLGQYIICVAPSNFGTGGVMKDYQSTSGVGNDDSSDENADENGIDNLNPATNGVCSGVIDVQPDKERTGEDQSGYTGALDDNNVNFTIDFGFIAPTAIDDGPEPTNPAANQIYLPVIEQ